LKFIFTEIASQVWLTVTSNAHGAFCLSFYTISKVAANRLNERAKRALHVAVIDSQKYEAIPSIQENKNVAFCDKFILLLIKIFQMHCLIWVYAVK